MNFACLPRFRMLTESQLSHESTHSVAISLLRGLAAIEVAAAHLRNEFFPALRTLDAPPLWYQLLAFATGFAHQAVVVFFLISGWLVGGSLLNKFRHPDALALYAIDRVTRLWTVLIPTFLLMLLIGLASGELLPARLDTSPGHAYSLTTFAGNLLGLQTIWLPEFGDNYPLWSLANETWYYLLFPLLLLAWRARGAARKTLAALLLGALVFMLPAPIVLYFSLWLLGAACARLRIDCPPVTQAGVLLILLGMAVYFRMSGHNDDQTLASFPQDLMLSLPIVFLLASLHQPFPARKRIARAVRRVGAVTSEFSFTLYVVHVPVLSMFHHGLQAICGDDKLPAARPADLAVYAAMLAVVLLFAYGFYLLFEARTAAVRRIAKTLLRKQTGPAGAQA